MQTRAVTGMQAQETSVDAAEVKDQSIPEVQMKENVPETA